MGEKPGIVKHWFTNFFFFLILRVNYLKRKKKKTNTDSLTQKENEETAKDIGKEAEGTKKDGQKSQKLKLSLKILKIT